jgi:hypothetical protein
MGSRSSGACLPGASVQESQVLLQSWENKTCGQQEPWGLLASMGYLEPQHLV